MENVKEYFIFMRSIFNDDSFWLTFFMVYSIASTFLWWTKGTVLSSAKKYIKHLEFQKERLCDEKHELKKDLATLRNILEIEQNIRSARRNKNVN